MRSMYMFGSGVAYVMRSRGAGDVHTTLRGSNEPLKRVKTGSGVKRVLLLSRTHKTHGGGGYVKVERSGGGR